jgi:serine/threonine protein kinase
MLTKSGVKLLDFGLAKLQPAGAVAGMSAAATMTSPLTGQGAILGTLHYMAPEQVEGKEADARSDIFSFGALVYEMTTSKRAFEGKSAASVMAAILEREPPAMSSLQPLAPPALDHLVRRCLGKDPDDRWQSAHDVLLQLRWVQEAGTAADTRIPSVRLSTREWVAWSLSAILVVAGAVATTAYLRQSREPPAPMRFSVLPPEQATFNSIDGPVTLSPDGRDMVFGATDAAVLRFCGSDPSIPWRPESSRGPNSLSIRSGRPTGATSRFGPAARSGESHSRAGLLRSSATRATAAAGHGTVTT